MHLQEVNLSSYNVLPHHSQPRVHAIPSCATHSFHEPSTAESKSVTGGGICLKTPQRNRFICWRVISCRVIEVVEDSLDQDLASNRIQLEFPVPLVLNGGVKIFESSEYVTLGMVTLGKTIHRLSFRKPNQLSINSVLASTPEFGLHRSMTQIREDAGISSVHWSSNEYSDDSDNSAGCEVFVGCTDGSVLRYDLGKSISDSTVRSAVHLNVMTYDTGSHVPSAFLDKSSSMHHTPVISIANTNSLVCAVSQDGLMRVWSRHHKQCQYVDNISKSFWDSEAEFEDAVIARGSTKSSASSGMCKFVSDSLVIVNVEPSNRLCGFRIEPSGMAFKAVLYRLFSMPAHLRNDSSTFRIVDVTVNNHTMYSVWKHDTTDVIISHNRVGSITGPVEAMGRTIKSIGDTHDSHCRNDAWLDEISDADMSSAMVFERIEVFYIERLLLPGRFSRTTLRSAMAAINPATRLKLGSLHECSETLRGFVKNQRVMSDVSSVERLMFEWQSLLDMCNHFERQNVPIAVVSTAGNATFPSPILLLRQSSINMVHQATVLTTSHQLVPDEDGLKAFSQEQEELVSFFIRNIDLDLVFENARASLFDSLQIALLNQEVNPHLHHSADALEIGNIMDLASSVISNSTMDAVPMSSFVLRASTYLTSQESTQRGHLLALVDCVAPPQSTEDFQAVTTDGSNNWIGSLYAGTTMKNAWASMLLSICSTTLERNLNVLLFLTYLWEFNMPFLDEDVKQFVYDVAIPRATLSLRFWAVLYWASSKRSTISRVIEKDNDDIDNDFSNMQLDSGNNISGSSSSILVGERLISEFYRASLPYLYQKLERDADESYDGEEGFDEYGDYHQSLKLGLVRIKMDKDDSCHEEDRHRLVVSMMSHCISRVIQREDGSRRIQPQRAAASSWSYRRPTFGALVKFLYQTFHYESLYVVLSNLYLLDQRSRVLSQEHLADLIFNNGLESLKPMISGNSVQRNNNNFGYTWELSSKILAECMLSFWKNSSDKIVATKCFNSAIDLYLNGRSISNSNSNEAEYYIDIMNLLKRNLRKGYEGCVLKFVTESIDRLTKTPNAASFPVRKALDFLWLNAFKYAVDMKDFVRAYEALRELEKGSETQRDCLRRLVLAFCESGNLQGLCRTAWGSFEAQVVSVLEWQAVNSDVIAHADDYVRSITRNDGGVQFVPSSISYYHILFSFHMQRNSPVLAAAAMNSLQMRLKAEMRVGKVSALVYRETALLACVNTLSIVECDNQWVLHRSAERVERVTLHTLQQELSLISARITLAKVKVPIHTCLSDSLGVVDIAQLLVNNLLIEAAVSLATLHGLDIEVIVSLVSRMTVEKLPTAHNSQLTWKTLQDLLERFDSVKTNFKYHLIAARSILETNVRVELPVWLVDSILGQNMAGPVTCKDSDTMTKRRTLKRSGFAGTGANPTSLLMLYIEFGLLIEACRLVKRLLPSTDEAACNRVDIRTYSTEEPKRIEWIPVNLLSHLLEICEYRVNEDNMNADSTLKTCTVELKQNLGNYQKLMAIAEKARLAAQMTQDGFEYRSNMMMMTST